MSVVTSRVSRRSILLGLASATLTPAVPRAAAQDEEIDTDALLTIELEAGTIPAPPAFLRLVRITLEPGATSPEHTHPGPEFGRIDSGVVSIRVNGPARIKQRSAKEADPFEDAAQNKDIRLDRGDQIYYPAGTSMRFTNKTEDEASILALVILPGDDERPPLIAYAEGTPTEETFEGVTSQVLGDGILTTAPGGPSKVTIRRLKLSEGQSLPGNRNPTLYSVVEGDCEFRVTAGSAQISRTRTPGPQLDAELDKDVKLRPGDAMFFPNGLRTTGRGENSDDLELIQVTVSPTGGERLFEENRGQIKFQNPSSPPPVDNDAPSADGEEARAAQRWKAGDTVFVNSTDVNLRDSPSINGGQVTVLVYGQKLTIDGDPTEADGIVWWPVHIAGDDTVAGYVSQEFIQSEPAE